MKIIHIIEIEKGFSSWFCVEYYINIWQIVKIWNWEIEKVSLQLNLFSCKCHRSTFAREKIASFALSSIQIVIIIIIIVIIVINNNNKIINIIIIILIFKGSKQADTRCVNQVNFVDNGQLTCEHSLKKHHLFVSSYFRHVY